MQIHASVRPKGLKRGVTDKKLASLLGFKEAQGLNTICGCLELSATTPQEFVFLKSLYDVFSWNGENHKNVVIIQQDDKEIIRYGDL